MKMLKNNLRELARYPSAIAGAVIIILLVILSIYTVIAIPYKDALRLWRGGEDIWYKNPKTAAPVWVNWFTATKKSETIFLSTIEEPELKTVTVDSSGYNRFEIVMPFEYEADEFPKDIAFYFNATYLEKQPHLAITMLTPDGRELRVADFSIKSTQTYRPMQDDRLTRRLGGLSAEKGFFNDPNATKENPVPLKGAYQLKIEGFTFEKDNNIDVELVMYGNLAGWAGTDHRRRDLGVALLWGTPVALAFGLLAALGTTVTTMAISGVATWFGGIVDDIIQRITEVNMMLPFLPILIMISTFYSRSIAVILGATILLSIFGSGIKTYRAVFMQIKESPYIEAARSYGASDVRIIFNYLIPRIIPLIIPQLVVLIPSFVFLEASLSLLGLGDPVLPTWGKIINDAQTNGALYQGQYYWVLEPAVLLIITGLAFALVGFALDRIFNPRLREL